MLERLLALVDERVSGDRAPAVREFARAYLRRLSPDGSDAGEEALLGEVVGAFELAAARNGAPMAVRAFNPTVADHGYASTGSVLETNTDDLPFLVDSVTGALQARAIGIVRVLHPIVGTQRDAAGRIAAVVHPGEGAQAESVMHFELDRRLAPEELADLEDGVRAVLADVLKVVHDFPAMRERLAQLVERVRAAAPEDAEETIAFLDWLARESFIFLGAIDEDRDGSGLGLLADPSRWGLSAENRGDCELVVTKARALSTVHRRTRLDEIALRPARVVGLFTTRAYSEPASETPLLRGKLARILGSEDLIEGSHDYKAAVALFDSFPKDELFAAPTEDLRRALVALLALAGDEVRLLGRRDPSGRSVSLILALPKARYDSALLDRVRALLRERFGTTSVDTHEVLGEGDRVRAHFSVHADDALADVPFRELETDVAELARTWDDRARERLVARHGDERGRMLCQRWGGRLPASYKAGVAPDAALDDIDCFERLFESGEDLVVGLRNERSQDGVLTRVGLYRSGGKVELSQVMPLLEDLGLRVIEERPSRLLGGDGEMWLQDFGVLGPGDAPLDLDNCAERVAETIAAIWRGRCESDSLNRLVVTTGLDVSRIEILRAYRKYRQRIGSRFTEGYQNDVIAANAELTEKLMRLFELRFDPAAPRDESAEEALREQILEGLDAVVSLDHDRILRNQLGLIEATVRTTAYKPGRRAIAFKLRSADVPAIPQPPPLFEIYLYSPEVEGIHLRGGAIARGGIRWSDRMDYRTEVFGLMRAQMTKNAVIVPAGAKGGFYVKRPPDDPAALRAEVERQYVTYIGGLLDLTDNLVDGEVVQPEGVRVLDGDDTYLVVAADKGTATFSDTANAVAERYGFWLGDAFASGGSRGYDHKKLGITARGAWESLKRHFRELDLDPAVDEFTVVGIGDMSGDVFGNGMLLSERIGLVAAYDHRHVFIDPNPDPAAGFAERKRLFELPASSWDDYDPATISDGGGVWSRAAKSIALSPQARAALAIEDEALPPNDVIRAILRAPVDVLWNGGIGTVVKASTESDDDALDRSSDSIRVDARELRSRVVAEGGNLGLTQRARIEFSVAGGRVNADFIDNSAGVDCSDHEVNLKVLVGLAVSRGELTGSERDELLFSVTDDVAAHVLYDSFLQAQILAQEVRASADRLFAYEDLMSALEAEGMLQRDVEALPGSEQMAERRRDGRGMERPELAVLLAYAKRSLTDALLRSSLPEDPYLERDLRGYFPRAVVERFGELLAEHPLRRELVATIVANEVVNALGPTFVSSLAAELGADPAAVVRAFRIAREVTGSHARWATIEGLGRRVERSAQWELMDGVDWLVEGVARWYVVNDPDADLGATIETAREGFERLATALPQLPADERRDDRERLVAELVERGVPDELARTHVFQAALLHTPDALVVASRTGRSVEEVAETFYRLGDALRFADLEDAILALPRGGRMQRWAAQAVLDDVLRARGELAARALGDAPGTTPEAAVERFLTSRGAALERFDKFARALAADEAADLAGLSLAVRQLRALAE